LFYEPIQILNIKILKDSGDTNKYIISLYTNESVINVDSNVTISKKNFDRMDNVKNFKHFYLYLRDIEFIRGTVQLQPKFGAVNTITPVTDINPLDYYMDALEICDNKLNHQTIDCNKNDLFCKQEMKLYRELRKTCNTQSNQENKDLNNQIDSKNQENQDLKQQLESKNQEIIELKKQNNKNPNNSLSTQTTIVIICVFIIIILLGLCIYLYFFKR